MTPQAEPHPSGNEEQVKVVEGDEPIVTNVDIEAGKNCHYCVELWHSGVR